jgi:hypothetical protein
LTLPTMPRISYKRSISMLYAMASFRSRTNLARGCSES